MGKCLKDHFAVSNKLHTAVKMVAIESETEINELVEVLLLQDSRILATYQRLVKK